MKKNIGFFGGTFDPIHIGHLNLAIEILEKAKLDKIIFCPAYVSPFKTQNRPKASSQDRLEMVKIAIKDIKEFEVFDFEIKNQGISYTIDTLEKLKNGANLKLIITEDSLQAFHQWKDYKNILQIAELLVGVKNKFLNAFTSENFTLNSQNFVQTNIFEISSTYIRERLKNRVYSAHLMPKEVLDYIYKRELYL